MMNSILINIKNGTKNGLNIGYKIALYVFPCYIIVSFLKTNGFLLKFGTILSPLLKLMGLPSEASIVILSGYLINLYAAIASIAVIGLTIKQITIIGIVLGIAHNLIVETVILSRSGIKAYIVLFYRILLSFFAGIIVNFIWNLLC